MYLAKNLNIQEIAFMYVVFWEKNIRGIMSRRLDYYIYCVNLSWWSFTKKYSYQESLLNHRLSYKNISTGKKIGSLIDCWSYCHICRRLVPRGYIPLRKHFLASLGSCPLPCQLQPNRGGKFLAFFFFFLQGVGPIGSEF